jgi:hypothetical protein
MKNILTALLISVAVLSGGGIAQAADVAQTNTQSKSSSTQSNSASAPIVVADTKAPETGVSQAHGPMALTDDQMNSVTAGHFYNQGYYHYGQYSPDYGVTWTFGYHY